MKRRLFLLVVSVLLGLFLGSFNQLIAADGSDQEQDARTDILYTCACGDGCTCNSVSNTPGNCKCGKPMEWGHVVNVEEDEALVCTCAEVCSCKQDTRDPTKCGCGKDLKRVSLKDTGIYFCNCGGSCTCNSVSAEAGPCKCGMKLKQM